MSILSPFAPSQFPTLPAITGIEIAVAASGLRYQGRDDLIAIRITTPAPAIAATFTQNTIVGEPVRWSRDCLPTPPQHLVISAGNANVLTGQAGSQVLSAIAEQIAAQEAITPKQVYFSMTGVIGELPSAAPLLQSLRTCIYSPPTAHLWERAARAMMTTDTFAKGNAETAKIGQQSVRLAGIAKGSGMIAPDMATMLAFLFTDATIPQSVLQAMLRAAIQDSFNAISVDSDTSTSDTVKLIATGAVLTPSAASAEDALYDDFRAALQRLCTDLARQVVCDGEGITKLIRVTVSEAMSKVEARQASLSIANSPLVKTAINGEDANWGRIAMAVGKSGVTLDPNALSIRLGDHLLASKGSAMPFDVEAVDEVIKNSEIAIHVGLGVGNAEASVWGNDLSYDYIRINADYRS